MISSLVGIGAGLVSALLFMVVAKGSALALLLSVVPALPIFIAALGWNQRSGLIATAAGALALGLAYKFPLGAVFAAGWGLPAWWLAYLALLARPRAEGSVEWYPTGNLLLWTAATGALVTLALSAAIGEGSYAAYREAMRLGFESILREFGKVPAAAALPALRGIPAEDVINGFVTALPFAMGWSFTLVLALNLWLSGKIVAISQRLARPWPSIPATALPRLALALLAGAAAGAFLPGFLGVLALALLGGLTAAFGLHGLAFIHDATRGRPGRGVLLAATYFFTLFTGHFAWPLLAAAGIADAAIGLRKRLTPGGPGPRST